MQPHTGMMKFSECDRFVKILARQVRWLLVAIASVLSVVAPSTSFAGASADPGCESQQRELQNAFSNPVPPQEVLNQLVAPTDQLLILAESHETHSLLVEPQLIGALAKRDARFKCVFLEFSNRDDLPSSDPYGQLIIKLELSGYKLRYIDQKKKVFPTNRFMNTQIRNKAMADQIKKSFIKGDCEAGMLIIGKAHLYSSLLGQPIQSISANLKKLGIKTKTINLINVDIEDARNESNVGEVYKYSENHGEIFSPACPVPVPNIDSPIGLVLPPLPSDLVYEPGTGGSFVDFDRVILVP